MRHKLENIQSVNNPLPGTGLLALEKCKYGSWFVSGSLMPPDYQKEKFYDAAPFGWLPEVLFGAINHQKGDDQGRNGVNNVTFEDPIHELLGIVKSHTDFYFKTKFIIIQKN